MTREQFSVDLHGVVDLLSNHLYSGPQVYIRELLQNAIDATSARDGGDAGTVRFALGEVDGRPALHVTDEGVGLSLDEARSFMGVIGRSSKRDEIGMARESLIGQFGVGILSCFAVSEQVRVLSTSAAGGETITWTGDADGTWVAATTDNAHPVGSTVTVVARHGEERWFEPDTIQRHLVRYGQLLKTPVLFDRDDGTTPVLITRLDVALRSAHATPDELLDFGREVLDIAAIDAFPISSTSSQTSGIAYVLPYEPAPGAARADQVYVKGMLVDEDCEKLLPEWAFFVRCIVESDGLHPTASREELHEDDMLEVAREELGQSVRSHLMNIASTSPNRLEALLATHHLSMKALAVSDPEFCALVTDWLPVHTAEGYMKIGEFRSRHPTALYTESVDEFRQVAPVALAQGIGLACGGYVYDGELLEATALAFDDFSVDVAKVEDLFRGFGVLTDAEVARFAALTAVAEERLELHDVEAALRRFEPAETPGMLAVSNEARELRSLQRGGEQANNLFSGILGAIQEHVPQVRPMLCLNADNRIIARLADTATTDPELAGHAIDLLYLQALMAGHHPFQASEAALLNLSLVELIDRATTTQTRQGDAS